MTGADAIWDRELGKPVRVAQADMQLVLDGLNRVLGAAFCFAEEDEGDWVFYADRTIDLQCIVDEIRGIGPPR